MHKLKEIALTNLLLDEANPRLGNPESASKWTQSLILQHFGAERKVQTLAADIGRMGVNPSKRPIVMPHPDKANAFVVLEGNRRLAALRLLADPHLAGTSHAQKLFRTASKSAIARPNQIECVVVPGREEADHWVRMEHGLGQDGTGTLAWGPREKSRYQERLHGDGRYSKSTALVDSLTDVGMIDATTARKVPITTLDRLLNDPEFRNGLSLDFEDLEIGDHNKNYLTRVMSDLASGDVKVDKVKTKELRRNYLNEVKSGARTPSAAALKVAGKASTGRPGHRAKAQSPSYDRNKLIPNNFRPTIAQRRLSVIYTELRRLNHEDHGNAIAVLFRTFLEIAVWDYLRRHHIQHPKGNDFFASRVKVAAKHQHEKTLIPESAYVGVVHAADDDSSFISLKALHQCVHGPYNQPTGRHLNKIWDNFEPFIDALFK